MIDSRPSKKKRVLLAVRYLWGDEGITTQMISIIGELKRRGWDVGVVCGISLEEARQHENLNWLLENTEFHYTPFPQSLTPSDIPRSLYCLYDVFKFTLKYNPYVIHTFSLSLVPYFFLIRTTIGINYISRCPINPYPDRSDTKIAAYINRLVDSFIGNKVVAISSDMRDIINRELNVPEERIQVILNGMDTSHFRPPSEEEALSCRTKFDVAEDDNVLCIVGRLDWVKGHDILFEALRMLQAEGYSFTLLCAGTGGYGEEIQELASELGIRDAIKFLGFTEPRSVYWASDVIVLPSRREGFACATAEAMLCGTVPIRTPTAGASDQIDDEENGFIVPFDAPDELARRIQFLLDHPDERRKMSEAAQTTAVDRFALESSVDKIESLYGTLIDD